MGETVNTNQTPVVEYDKVSPINNPKDNTVVFITCAIEYELSKLQEVRGCLVFIEEGMELPASLKDRHTFLFSSNPALNYAEYTHKIAEKESLNNKQRQYRLQEEGYYLGENVTIGENVFIEPGALIGHDVVIGDNVSILSHAIVKDARIGKNCLIKEFARIGCQAFTITTNDEGNKVRMPCLGGVLIEDDVEIGSFSTINRGLNSDTHICSFVKIDDHVGIGHDAVIGRNTLIVAGAVLGGYVSVGESVYIGLNASLKNRINIGSGTTISLGARVVKDVEAGQGTFGVPKSNN